MLRIGRIVGIAYLGLCVVLFASLILGGPGFYAPLSSLVAPAPEPVTITLAVSSEKEAWLNDAVARFEASKPTVGRRPIDVELESAGSLKLIDDILNGRLRPTAISPASTIELRLLEAGWQQRTGGAPLLTGGSFTPQPLVFTPLVLLTWSDIGAQRWNGDTFTWEDLYAAVTATDQNYLKLGHTRPTSSNSGLAMELLLLYSYYDYDTSRQLQVSDIQNPAFQRWLTTFEQNVSVLEDSSETLVRNMVLFGPSRYEAVISYENLAVQYALTGESRWGEIRIYYPPANLYSDHPFAILQGDWVDADQQEAARMLRDYLLGSESQQLALSYGFRPANPEVSIQADDSPFQRLARYGLRPSIDQLIAEPPVEVVQALRDLWTHTIQR
ncbi:MAG: hypothetical protein KatS3mg057_0224 [Herpetosiphonaceae bacterium]|nr:MAG: hypothetical protein KatS3mg057_0224 [Herpetosiphonaceae bacterium]